MFTICNKILHRLICLSLVVIFLSTTIAPPVYAQLLTLPGAPVAPMGFQPPVLKALTIHPENPLLFEFIVDRGQEPLAQEALKSESTKLVKFFLTALTIPDQESWVNLSPLEKDRIIPEALGSTEMGKQMLEQDYLLKQLAANLTNPNTELGKTYWKKADDTERRVQTEKNILSKVWILPDSATIAEKGGFAYITASHLKVMMDSEYQGHQVLDSQQDSLFRELILPQLEKAVNDSKDFAPTRQIYHSVILAAWYKRAVKESLLGKIYIDRSKIKGVQTSDKAFKDQIYEQYLSAFKQGVYSLIKEEEDALTGEVIPRKYFSGGETFGDVQRKLNVVRGASAAVVVAEGIKQLNNRASSAVFKFAETPEEFSVETDAVSSSALVEKVEVAQATFDEFYTQNKWERLKAVVDGHGEVGQALLGVARLLTTMILSGENNRNPTIRQIQNLVEHRPEFKDSLAKLTLNEEIETQIGPFHQLTIDGKLDYLLRKFLGFQYSEGVRMGSSRYVHRALTERYQGKLADRRMPNPNSSFEQRFNRDPKVLTPTKAKRINRVLRPRETLEPVMIKSGQAAIKLGEYILSLSANATTIEVTLDGPQVDDFQQRTWRLRTGRDGDQTRRIQILTGEDDLGAIAQKLILRPKAGSAKTTRDLGIDNVFDVMVTLNWDRSSTRGKDGIVDDRFTLTVENRGASVGLDFEAIQQASSSLFYFSESNELAQPDHSSSSVLNPSILDPIIVEVFGVKIGENNSVFYVIDESKFKTTMQNIELGRETIEQYSQKVMDRLIEKFPEAAPSLTGEGRGLFLIRLNLTITLLKILYNHIYSEKSPAPSGQGGQAKTDIEVQMSPPAPSADVPISKEGPNRFLDTLLPESNLRSRVLAAAEEAIELGHERELYSLLLKMLGDPSGSQITKIHEGILANPAFKDAVKLKAIWDELVSNHRVLPEQRREILLFLFYLNDYLSRFSEGWQYSQDNELVYLESAIKDQKLLKAVMHLLMQDPQLDKRLFQLRTMGLGRLQALSSLQSSELDKSFPLASDEGLIEQMHNLFERFKVQSDVVRTAYVINGIISIYGMVQTQPFIQYASAAVEVQDQIDLKLPDYAFWQKHLQFLKVVETFFGVKILLEGIVSLDPRSKLDLFKLARTLREDPQQTLMLQYNAVAAIEQTLKEQGEGLTEEGVLEVLRHVRIFTGVMNELFQEHRLSDVGTHHMLDQVLPGKTMREQVLFYAKEIFKEGVPLDIFASMILTLPLEGAGMEGFASYIQSINQSPEKSKLSDLVVFVAQLGEQSRDALLVFLTELSEYVEQIQRSYQYVKQEHWLIEAANNPYAIQALAGVMVASPSVDALMSELSDIYPSAKKMTATDLAKFSEFVIKMEINRNPAIEHLVNEVFENFGISEDKENAYLVNAAMVLFGIYLSQKQEEKNHYRFAVAQRSVASSAIISDQNLEIYFNNVVLPSIGEEYQNQPGLMVLTRVLFIRLMRYPKQDDLTRADVELLLKSKHFDQTLRTLQLTSGKNMDTFNQWESPRSKAIYIMEHLLGYKRTSFKDRDGKLIDVWNWKGYSQYAQDFKDQQMAASLKPGRISRPKIISQNGYVVLNTAKSQFAVSLGEGRNLLIRIESKNKAIHLSVKSQGPALSPLETRVKLANGLNIVGKTPGAQVQQFERVILIKDAQGQDLRDVDFVVDVELKKEKIDEDTVRRVYVIRLLNFGLQPVTLGYQSHAEAQAVASSTVLEREKIARTIFKEQYQDPERFGEFRKIYELADSMDKPHLREILEEIFVKLFASRRQNPTAKQVNQILASNQMLARNLMTYQFPLGQDERTRRDYSELNAQERFIYFMTHFLAFKEEYQENTKKTRFVNPEFYVPMESASSGILEGDEYQKLPRNSGAQQAPSPQAREALAQKWFEELWADSGTWSKLKAAASNSPELKNTIRLFFVELIMQNRREFAVSRIKDLLLENLDLSKALGSLALREDGQEDPDFSKKDPLDKGLQLMIGYLDFTLDGSRLINPYFAGFETRLVGIHRASSGISTSQKARAKAKQLFEEWYDDNEFRDLKAVADRYPRLKQVAKYLFVELLAKRFDKENQGIGVNSNYLKGLLGSREFDSEILKEIPPPFEGFESLDAYTKAVYIVVNWLKFEEIHIDKMVYFENKVANQMIQAGLKTPGSSDSVVEALHKLQLGLLDRVMLHWGTLREYRDLSLEPSSQTFREMPHIRRNSGYSRIPIVSAKPVEVVFGGGSTPSHSFRFKVTGNEVEVSLWGPEAQLLEPRTWHARVGHAIHVRYWEDLPQNLPLEVEGRAAVAQINLVKKGTRSLESFRDLDFVIRIDRSNPSFFSNEAEMKIKNRGRTFSLYFHIPEQRAERLGQGKTGASSALEAVGGRASPVGGIDFDASKLNLQIKRDGNGVPLPLSQQDWEHIDIQGLTPIMINIQPINVSTLPILGLNQTGEAKQLSLVQ